MRCLLKLSLAIMAAVSAGAPQVGAATYLPLNRQRIVPLAGGEVWRRLHDFLQDQGFAVTSESRTEGVIDAARATTGRAGFTGFAQCSPHLFWRTAQAKITLTIQLKAADDGTRVLVNTGFLEQGRPGRKGVPSLSCTSNGVLETAVLGVAAGQPMESAVVPQ